MVDSEMEQKPVISKNAAKKTGNPGRKRNQDPNLRGHASPLKSAFVTAPLPARSEPSTSEESSFQAQAQPAECASPTSTFILREMVPVAYKYGDSLENESVAPASTCDTGTSVAQISDLWAAPSLDAFDDGLQLPATSNDHLTPSALSDSSSPVRVFSLEESALFETTRQRNTAVTEQAASKRMQDLRHSRSKATIPPPPDAPKSRPRTLRTILPSNIPFSNTVSAPQHLFFYSSDTKENTMIPPQRVTRPKLRSSGPRVLPPLFANTDLRNLADRQTMPYSASLSASSPTTVSKLPTQIFEDPFEVPNLWPLDEGLGPTQINDQMDHDYTSAPLKYLDVLAPFSDEGLPGNDIMNRLLEPDLVEHDPFQAAMGLVFVSQLGQNIVDGARNRILDSRHRKPD
ncbi:hypothetical protein H0H93_012430 [Arthromyces matolae]|nr:hypothetical protein H0H93_012430 [Arthromyces matolae]